MGVLTLEVLSLGVLTLAQKALEELELEVLLLEVLEVLGLEVLELEVPVLQVLVLEVLELEVLGLEVLELEVPVLQVLVLEVLEPEVPQVLVLGVLHSLCNSDHFSGLSRTRRYDCLAWRFPRFLVFRLPLALLLPYCVLRLTNHSHSYSLTPYYRLLLRTLSRLIPRYRAS
ncbi:unnamed protein product [Closterium sp. Yama58-4]|nr:unnamed protein product [Closterium sp. Yama58-4]